MAKQISLADLRKSYPEYDGVLDDEQFKQGIYKKFYSPEAEKNGTIKSGEAISFEEFEKRLATAPASKAKDLRDSLGSGLLAGSSSTVDFGAAISEKIMNLPLEITQKLKLMELLGAPEGTSETAFPQLAPKDPDAQTVRGAVSDLTGGYTEYQPQSFEGEYLRTGGEFVGGAAVLPIGGPLRSMASAVVPSILSETAGQLTQDTEYEDMARIAGALGLPVAQAIANPALRRMALGDPKEIYGNLKGSNRKDAVSVLNEQGVTDISAGQQVGSKNLMLLEGAENPSLLAKQQLTQATLRKAGSNADNASPEALNAARLRIGKVFNTVDGMAGGVPKASEVNVMIRAVQKASGDMSIGNIPKNLKDIVKGFRDAAENGTAINSKNISKIRTDLNESMMKYAKNNDMISYDLAYDIKEALDNIVLRQIPKQLRPSLDNARNQYRAYLTLEKGIMGGGVDKASGLLSPDALAGATRMREGKSYVKGTGSDMADLARASQEVLSPLPAVSAGGKRIDENLFTFAKDIIPRIYAKNAQDTLPLNTLQATFPSLFERIARQTGGLLNID